MSGPVLVAEAVRVRYGRREVLRGVSVGVARGELLAVIGPNGAGKTTLLRTLARLDRPTSGRVTLDGRDVWATPARQVAGRVAFAPQDADWGWAATVREYVSLGRAPHAGWVRPLSPADKLAIDAALIRLDLTPFADRAVSTLSGGEGQRVRLARALAQSPAALLLDEPTTHLDPRFQAELLHLVHAATRDRDIAAVMTLHDLNLVGPWADRVALMKDGELAAVGRPAEVLTAERLEWLFDTPFAVGPHPVTGHPAVALRAKTP